MKSRLALAVAAGLLSTATWAQVPQYGPNITLEQAKKAMTAAEAEARKKSWPVAIAIVDTAGNLVHFSKLDGTQTASVMVAQDKAVSSAIYRRSTKVFQDGLAAAGAGLRILQLRGASAVDGGFPILVDGKVIGGIGTSGVQGHEDAEVSKAGADALK